MPSIFILLFLVASQLTLAAVDEMPYCTLRYRRLCQGKGQHIACTFPDPGPGVSCTNHTAIKFNNQMKDFILFYVNRRRQRIASGNEKVRGGLRLPRPEVMMLVEWDRELAFLAQRLADQCHFVHDECRATVRYPYAGQTVGEVRWRRSGESVERGARRAIRRVLDAWWGERRRATPQQLTAPFHVAARGAVWGHFSQLCIWDLQAMGCGAVHHGTTHPRLLLVCDFSHTNMLGQRTLTPGPLLPCPIHTMRKPRTQFPLLCAPLRHSTPSATDESYDEYGDEVDPGLTVDVGEVSSSSIKYSRSTWVRGSTRPIQSTSSAVVFTVEELRPRAKGLLLEKLDRELEELNKAGDKAIAEENDGRPYFGKLGEHQERFEDVIPLYSTLMREHFNEKPYYRFTSTLTTPVGILMESNQRQRWKHTRVRPVRPGANALLITALPVKYLKQQSVGSLMLDKDDVDQLYRDTGFKLTRRTIYDRVLIK